MKYLRVALIGLIAGIAFTFGNMLVIDYQMSQVNERIVKKDDGIVKFARQIAIFGLIKSANAGSLSDFAENKLVDTLLRGQTLGAPSSWYIALFTDTCSDAGPGTEVSTSSTGYSRQSVASSLAAWAGTQSAGSTATSSGTSGTTSNNAVISWSASTATWGTVQSVGWMDASTGGNRWICINLTSPLAVSGSGFTLSFAAGQLSFQIDN